MLGSLFSRDGRASLGSRIEYERCRLELKKLRCEFRERAEQELKFQYPDAQILLNDFDPGFLVLLADRILRGDFADPHLPILDFVAEEDLTHVRNQAVYNFRSAKSHGYLSSPTLKGLTWAELTDDSYYGSLQKKGYRIRRDQYGDCYTFDCLIGATLILNGKVIAKSTVKNPRSRGYFGGQILRLLNGEGLHPMQNHLTVRAVIDPGAAEIYSHRSFIAPTIIGLDREHREAVTRSFIRLRDFLYGLESHIQLQAARHREESYGDPDHFKETEYETELLEAAHFDN